MTGSALEVRINTNNPEPRTPCALVLDCSASMSGRPIAELNRGLRRFADDAKEDPYARKRCEVTVVSFGGKAQVDRQFCEIRDFEPPELLASGNTPMADALALAVSGLEQRKKQYRATGIEYLRPWLILMTDGRPTDARSYFDETIAHLNTLERKQSLMVFPIAVGDEADLAALGRTSIARQPVKLRDVESFGEFFAWLAASLSVTSQSVSGQVPLPPLDGWASV
jgi:uncharacterized protein YegL